VAEAVRLLVTTGRTLALVAVGILSAAPDARDPLLQQGEFLLEFGDSLTMALDLFQEDRKFKSITLRHRARG